MSHLSCPRSRVPKRYGLYTKNSNSELNTPELLRARHLFPSKLPVACFSIPKPPSGDGNEHNCTQVAWKELTSQSRPSNYQFSEAEVLKIARISLLIPILLLGTIVAPNVVHLAHAITGEVCLADPTTAGSASPCPATPPLFSGPIGQQIRIGVFVQGSDALNGFDVSLTANKTILVPVGADLTGTVLPGTPTIILECLQGVLINGSVCSPTDNITTMHFTATAGLGSITTPPTTGLLFTAVYNITGTAPATGVSVSFPTGCSGTSVASGVCVTISSGSTTPVSETTQQGTLIIPMLLQWRSLMSPLLPQISVPNFQVLPTLRLLLRPQSTATPVFLHPTPSLSRPRLLRD